MLQDNSRTYTVPNVELHWAKLDPENPVKPFEAVQWEAQIHTADKAVADEWSKNYLNVKEKDGSYYVQLVRNAFKRDGKPNNPVGVVGRRLEPIDPNTIGNGSIANVKIYQFNYQMNGGGVGSRLSNIQIVDLKEYTPNTAGGFEAIDAPSDEEFAVVEDSTAPMF